MYSFYLCQIFTVKEENKINSSSKICLICSYDFAILLFCVLYHFKFLPLTYLTNFTSVFLLVSAEMDLLVFHFLVLLILSYDGLQDSYSNRELSHSIHWVLFWSYLWRCEKWDYTYQGTGDQHLSCESASCRI